MFRCKNRLWSGLTLEVRKSPMYFLPQIDGALGLAETRRVLRETLEWPTKYAAIFAQSPLRLRSGYVDDFIRFTRYTQLSAVGFCSMDTPVVGRLCLPRQL